MSGERLSLPPVALAATAMEKPLPAGNAPIAGSPDIAPEKVPADATGAAAQRKRGRPPKQKLTDRELLLLTVYFELLPDDKEPSTLIRHISEEFHKRTKPGGKRIFQSPEALEKRIRRLLKGIECGKLATDDRSYPDWWNPKILL